MLAKHPLSQVSYTPKIGSDGEIRTHGPYYYERQVSNLLPSATRPRHYKLTGEFLKNIVNCLTKFYYSAFLQTHKNYFHCVVYLQLLLAEEVRFELTDPSLSRRFSRPLR